MSHQTWMRAKEIFAEAVELPAHQQAALLDRACAGDTELRRQVEVLLRSHLSAGDFLQSPTLPILSSAIPPSEADPGEHPLGERPGDLIGLYKILSVLGEGGFGIVYLAERRAPFVQRVAIKVVKPGMDSRAVIARFEQERQALAILDHPNVARVYDAGTTPQGRPYFAMELVQGESITRYCDRHTLGVRQRLELFICVCEAVQHAHMKGIIHRDLKPSNILVMLREGQPTPKVIDFGVAKAITHTLTDKTIFTEQGRLIGTPEYMSPEQAEMGALDIDTRADVYSLGVVLYEMLVGAAPFDTAQLRAGGFAAIQRYIQETEPPRPSTRLTSLATAQEVARLRKTRVEELSGLLKRELEWIPLKAMRKDRTERKNVTIPVRGFETGSRAYTESSTRQVSLEPSRGRTIAVSTRPLRCDNPPNISLFGSLLSSLFLSSLGSSWSGMGSTNADLADDR